MLLVVSGSHRALHFEWLATFLRIVHFNSVELLLVTNLKPINNLHNVKVLADFLHRVRTIASLLKITVEFSAVVFNLSITI